MIENSVATTVGVPRRRRGTGRVGTALLVNLLAVTLGLLGGVVVIAATGLDVGPAVSAIITGAFGSAGALRETLRQAVPILIGGLGVSYGLRAGLFNIGGEGQIYIGALVAVVVALAVPGLGPVVVLAAGMLGGALWGGAAGAMRAWLRMDEVITTILLNFVAFWGVSYAVNGPLKDPNSSGYPWTVQVAESVRLGSLPLGPVRVPVGLLIGLIAAIAVAVVIGRTRHGMELRLVGTSRSAATFAGVPVRRRQFQALAASGALAGLAGAVELIGAQLRLSDFFSPSYGFTAIAVALVGNANPYGCVAAALTFGSLRAGAASMERAAQVPAAISLVVQGVIIIALILVRSPVVMRLLTDRLSLLAPRRATVTGAPDAGHDAAERAGEGTT